MWQNFAEKWQNFFPGRDKVYISRDNFSQSVGSISAARSGPGLIPRTTAGNQAHSERGSLSTI